MLVIYTPRAAADAIDLARALVEVSRKTAKPIIAAWMGGERAAEGRRILLQNNVPAYATPEEAVKTYLYMYRYRRNIDLLYETPAEVAQTGPRLKNYLKTILRKAMKEQRRILARRESLDLLKNYRIQTVRTAVVTDIDEAPRRARDVGFPLLLTIRYLHEDREDQVISLATEKEVDRVCREVRQTFSREGDESKQDVEIVLQKAAAPDTYRLKLESRRDPDFRTVLVLNPGPGGADAVCIGLPPLNQTLAKRLLEQAGVFRALEGAEAGEGAHRRLEETLGSFATLVVDFPEIESLKLVLSVWQENVLAEDVKVMLAHDYDVSSPYPHLVITPYPSRYVTTWSLRDGTEVLLGLSVRKTKPWAGRCWPLCRRRRCGLDSSVSGR